MYMEAISIVRVLDFKFIRKFTAFSISDFIVKQMEVFVINANAQNVNDRVCGYICGPSLK